jgi:hypothetical protein
VEVDEMDESWPKIQPQTSPQSRCISAVHLIAKFDSSGSARQILNHQRVR